MWVDLKPVCCFKTVILVPQIHVRDPPTLMPLGVEGSIMAASTTLSLENDFDFTPSPRVSVQYEWTW